MRKGWLNITVQKVYGSNTNRYSKKDPNDKKKN